MTPNKKKKSRVKRTEGKSRTAKTTSKKQRKKVVKLAAPKKSSKKKAARRKTSLGASALPRARKSATTEKELQREVRNENRIRTARASSRQTGDLQGLSRAEQADSESVDELVEEGNLFEAGAVAGVEKADDEDEKEVRTRELPEDDVPEEYLDEE